MPSPVRENGKFPYYAFPGGYTIIYIAGDNEVLCPECANLPEAYSTAEKREAIKKGLDREDGPPDYTDRAWELVAVDTYDEGLPIQCAHCNKDIESSYGPTDADYRDMIRDWHHQITKRDPSAGVLEDILQYVKDEEENEGGPNDMRGNYHSVGVFVREFIDNDAKSHEKPVGRRQKIRNPITYEGNRFGHYLVTTVEDTEWTKDIHGTTIARPPKHELYFQTDWDFPGLAETFGWDGKILPMTKTRAVNIKDDDQIGREIYSAIQYLDANEGKVVEDPGYWEGDD